MICTRSSHSDLNTYGITVFYMDRSNVKMEKLIHYIMRISENYVKMQTQNIQSESNLKCVSTIHTKQGEKLN